MAKLHGLDEFQINVIRRLECIILIIRKRIRLSKQTSLRKSDKSLSVKGLKRCRLK